MQFARASLATGFEAELVMLDDHFQKLYQLAEGVNKVSSYDWRISSVRKALPKITSRLEMQIGTDSGNASQSADETKIIDTLMGLVETAGLPAAVLVSIGCSVAFRRLHRHLEAGGPRRRNPAT
jgi:hypothetical protein